MSIVVWTTLITAVATVTASLGAVWIKSEYDDRSQARQAVQNRAATREGQQRQAYGELVKTARLALRNLRQLAIAYAANTPDTPAVEEAFSQASILAADMNRASAVAELIGSPQGRQHARAVYDKAKACADYFQTREVLLAALPHNSPAWRYANFLPGGIGQALPFDAEKARALCGELATAIDQFTEAVNAELAQ